MTRIVRCTHDKPAGADLCFACIMLNTVNALWTGLNAPVTDIPVSKVDLRDLRGQ